MMSALARILLACALTLCLACVIFLVLGNIGFVFATFIAAAIMGYSSILLTLYTDKRKQR